MRRTHFLFPALAAISLNTTGATVSSSPKGVLVHEEEIRLQLTADPPLVTLSLEKAAVSPGTLEYHLEVELLNPDDSVAARAAPAHRVIHRGLNRGVHPAGPHGQSVGPDIRVGAPHGHKTQDPPDTRAPAPRHPSRPVRVRGQVAPVAYGIPCFCIVAGLIAKQTARVQPRGVLQ